MGLSSHGHHADALFVSLLEPSDEPSALKVKQAIAHAEKTFGAAGCAARVAQEYGDHPETAAARMRWANDLVSLSSAQRPETAFSHHSA
jgi:hypothetical protein